MSKSIALFLLFSLYAGFSKGQVLPKWKITDTLSTSCRSVYTDPIGNIYVLDYGNRLVKYATNGRLLATLNFPFNGSIGGIDARNPMEVLVFYPELNALIIVDNNLAIKGRVELMEWGISQAQAIGRSYENGFWIVDASDLKIKKFGREGSFQLETGNALQFGSSNQMLIAKQIIDNGTQMVVVDTSQGVFVFDVFGQFIKKIPFSAFSGAAYYGKDLLLFGKEQVIKLDLNSLKRQVFPSPLISIQALIPAEEGAFWVQHGPFLFHCESVD